VEQVKFSAIPSSDHKLRRVDAPSARFSNQHFRVRVENGRMPMSGEIDAAYARLLDLEPELRAQAKLPLNESDTRFRLLDRVLTDILGWPRDSIETEPPTSEGFIDYCINSNGRPRIIIEAKRNGSLSTSTVSLKPAALMLNGPVLKPLRAAVDQALRYASAKSVPVAAVTDGTCWLFFQTNRRDGMSAKDGKGWFFPDLTAVKAEFARFYDLLVH
jgi:hypothetical protein